MVVRTCEVTSHGSFVFTHPTVSEIDAEGVMPLTGKDQYTSFSCQNHCDWQYLSMALWVGDVERIACAFSATLRMRQH
jgi:hypothetical protein